MGEKILGLVFFHVEKSGGTSIRTFFKNHFPEPAMLFSHHSGIEITNKMFERHFLIGGHNRHLSAYQGIPLVFTGVLREPVSRAISLFNYRATKDIPNWKGFDTNSFKNTLFGCEVFRRKINNGQCLYFSGRRDFSSVLEALERYPFLIGSLENIETYSGKLFGELGVSKKIALPKANVGDANYRDSVSLDKETLSELESLVAEDARFYNFVSRSEGGLFDNVLPRQWQELRQGVMQKTWGQKNLDRYVSSVRDAAIALETQDLSLAYELMELANVIRPNGPAIRKKLQEYKKRLDK